MKAIVTVLGSDKVGIIAAVTGELARLKVNIEDISQTLMQEHFVMIMTTDVSKSPLGIKEIGDKLKAVGENIGVDIRIQHEDIFNSMHRI